MKIVHLIFGILFLACMACGSYLLLLDPHPHIVYTSWLVLALAALSISCFVEAFSSKKNIKLKQLNEDGFTIQHPAIKAIWGARPDEMSESEWCRFLEQYFTFWAETLEATENARDEDFITVDQMLDKLRGQR